MVALIPNFGIKHNLGGRTQRKRKQKSGGTGGRGVPPKLRGQKKIFCDKFLRKPIHIVCTPSLCPTATSEKNVGVKGTTWWRPPLTTCQKLTIFALFRILSTKRPSITSGRSNIFCITRNSASNREVPVIVAQKRIEIRGFES